MRTSVSAGRLQASRCLLRLPPQVATGLLLVLQLLTPLRSLLTTVFYAQILKLKLHLPDSAVLHRQVGHKGRLIRWCGGSSSDQEDSGA